jgi:hypothetical protein
MLSLVEWAAVAVRAHLQNDGELWSKTAHIRTSSNGNRPGAWRIRDRLIALLFGATWQPAHGASAPL